MKWIGSGIAVIIAIACALGSGGGAAAQQDARDPQISPQEGDRGSRFQVVGLSGWTPGETVTVRIAYTSGDPFAFTGPFAVEETVTVLRDGTWSFPVVLTDALLGAPLPDTPGFIVVRAESPTKSGTNAFIYSPGGRRPALTSVVASLGFGPGPGLGIALAAALFAGATGSLLVVSGLLRRGDALAI